jgi:two-component system KDP operon response regulator KdpE
MSTSPVYPETPQIEPASLPRPAAPVRAAGGPIALVIRGREYASLSVIPALVRHGFTSAERTTDDALEFLDQLRPSVVLCVVDPARGADIELIRDVASRLPAFILLLAPTSEAFAAGLEAGADACLCEKDSPETLDAQIRAIKRRLPGNGDQALDFPLRGFRIDLDSRRFQKGDQPIPLTSMEFSILSYLAEHAGRVTSPMELLHGATGRLHTEAEASQAVKVYVGRLRKKLQAQGADPAVIANVRGYGYMLERRQAAGTNDSTDNR